MGKRYPMTQEVVDLVTQREGGRCAVCAGMLTGPGHLHHRKPRRMGGSRYANTASNVVLLHPSCHLDTVERDRARSYQNGWLLRANEEPSEVPLRYMMNRWALLDDIGNALPWKGLQ